jgi:CBS domain containing-hemolysin-like protein
LLTLAIWFAVIFAFLAVISAVVKAALEASDDESEMAESVGFLRMSLTGISGIIIGQAVSLSGLSWWWATLIAFILILILLFGSQLTSRNLGHRSFGLWLKKATNPIVRSLHIMFTPLSLPKEEEPEEFEQELLDSVEEFGETIVREIMVPRVDMATIPEDASLTAAMSVFLARGFSRLPVVGKKIDDIKGILYIKDVARIQHEDKKKLATLVAAEIARPALFVPESKPVDDLLRDMQLSSRHIAVIVDEYGGVAGLVTMEDLIEEIVGEISDEYDRDAPDLVEISDGSYRMTARYSLFDLGELFEIELEDEDVDTVGGLLTKALGRLPSKGDSVQLSGLKISAEVVEARRRRLITVRVERDENLTDAISAFESGDKND